MKAGRPFSSNEEALTSNCITACLLRGTESLNCSWITCAFEIGVGEDPAAPHDRTHFRILPCRMYGKKTHAQHNTHRTPCALHAAHYNSQHTQSGTLNTVRSTSTSATRTSALCSLCSWSSTSSLSSCFCGSRHSTHISPPFTTSFHTHARTKTSSQHCLCP